MTEHEEAARNETAPVAATERTPRESAGELNAEQLLRLGQALRLADAVGTLSLDVARPLYAAIGLSELDGAALCQACRDVVELHREKMGDRPEPMEDMRALLRSAVEQRMGTAAWPRIRAWLDGVHHLVFTDLPHENAWLTTLEAAAYDNAPLGLTPKMRRELLTELEEALDLSDLEHLFADLQERGWSDWDVEMFARRGDNPFDMVCDPFMPFRRAARMVRFRGYLAKLARHVPADELDHLHEAVQRHLQTEGVELGEPLHPLRVVAQGAHLTEHDEEAAC